MATEGIEDRRRIDMFDVGRRAARRRDDLLLSQMDLAKESGLSRAYISRVESGGVLSPKLQDLARLADALKMPMDELVHGSPEDDDALTSHLNQYPELASDLRLMVHALSRATGEEREITLAMIRMLAQRLAAKQNKDPSQ